MLIDAFLPHKLTRLSSAKFTTREILLSGGKLLHHYLQLRNVIYKIVQKNTTSQEKYDDPRYLKIKLFHEYALDLR